MKSFNLLIVLTLLAAISSKIDSNSNIYKAVQAILPSLPELRKAVLEEPTAKEGELQPIINRGYTSFAQKTEVLNYNGVDPDSLDDFIVFLDDVIGLPPKFKAKFNAALSLIEFADMKEFIAGNFLFSVDTGGECKYVLIFTQRNKDDSTDWLVGNVQTTFTLAPDLLIYEESSRSVLGFKKTKTVAKEIPKVLTDPQMETLNRFFQATIIERFGVTLGLIKNLR